MQPPWCGSHDWALLLLELRRPCDHVKCSIQAHWWLLRAARCSGVLPAASIGDASTAVRSSCCRAAASPNCAAQCSGPLPSCTIQGLGFSMHACTVLCVRDGTPLPSAPLVYAEDLACTCTDILQRQHTAHIRTVPSVAAGSPLSSWRCAAPSAASPQSRGYSCTRPAHR